MVILNRVRYKSDCAVKLLKGIMACQTLYADVQTSVRITCGARSLAWSWHMLSLIQCSKRSAVDFAPRSITACVHLEVVIREAHWDPFIVLAWTRMNMFGHISCKFMLFQTAAWVNDMAGSFA